MPLERHDPQVPGALRGLVLFFDAVAADAMRKRCDLAREPDERTVAALPPVAGVYASLDGCFELNSVDNMPYREAWQNPGEDEPLGPIWVMNFGNRHSTDGRRSRPSDATNKVSR